MDNEGKIKLKQHLSDLIIFTEISQPFLEYFRQKGILALPDIDFLTGQPSKMVTAAEFYNVIQTRKNSYPTLIEILQKTNQSAIVDILENGIIAPHLESLRAQQLSSKNEGGNSQSYSFPIPRSNTKFEVSAPVSSFLGRDDELKQLHENVQRSDKAGQVTVISQLTSISGLGGIGKTQLARQYLHRYGEQYDGNCIWLAAETENSIGESFRRLAKDTLGITTKDANNSDKNIKSIVTEVYKYFALSKCIFVFDNAENEAWLHQYFPVNFHSSKEEQNRPQIIITSRNREWNIIKGIEVIDIKELKEEDAITLVKRGLNLETDASQDIEITQIVQKFQCFPLALQQAISYIQEELIVGEYSVAEYLKDFQKQQEELLSHDEMNHELSTGCNLTTFTTWKMTVEKIGLDQKCGSTSLQILYAMAYLSPDRIKREMFSSHPCFKEERPLRLAARLLVKYSMVSGEDKQSILSIHRLVQEVTQINLRTENKEIQVLDGVMKMVGGSDKLLPTQNLGHILAAWPHVFKHQPLLQTYSSLVNRTAYRLGEQGSDDEAIKFGEATAPKLTKAVGEYHYDVLALILTTGETMLDRGQVAQAEVKIRHVLERSFFHLLPIYTGLFLEAIRALGSIYMDAMRCEEAIELYEFAYDQIETFFPGNNLVILSTRELLGSALFRVGRLDEAVEILTDVYQQQQNDPNRNLASLLSAQLSLAQCLNQQNNFEGALSVLEKEFATFDSLSGTERIHAISIMEMTGGVLRKLFRYDEALEKHTKAYKENFKIFGREHRDTIISLGHLGESMSHVGRHEEAIKHLKETFYRLRDILGGNDYDVMRIQLAVGEALMREAVDLPRAVRIMERLKLKLTNMGWYNYDAGVKSVLCWNLDTHLEAIITIQGLCQIRNTRGGN